VLPVAVPADGRITSLEQLIAARQQRGLSVSDVAAKLGMVPRQIEALEHADWDALPGQAFVRGAIRAYGKTLQLDIEPLLTAVGGHAKAADLRPSSSLEAPLPKHGALGFSNGGSGSKLVWILLGVLGVIAIAFYFGRSADFSGVIDRDAPSAPGRTIESVPVQPPGSGTSPGGNPDGRGLSTPGAAGASPQGAAGSNAPGQGAAAGGASSATGSAGAAPVVAGGAAGSNVPGSAANAGPGAGAATSAAASVGTPGSPGTQALVPPAGAAATTAGASRDALRFTFERESWVDIRDAAGNVLLFGTQPAQSTREVQGKRPYTLTVGNAGYVRLERDGQVIDLKAPSRQGVARLTVD